VDGLGTFVCADCSGSFERTGHHQIVCKSCAKVRRVEKDKRINERRKAQRKKTIICADCKAVVQKTGNRMILCKSCSKERKRKRTAKWVENNLEYARASARERNRRNKERQKAAYQYWLKHRYPVIRKKQKWEERENARIELIRSKRAEKRERKKAKKDREIHRRYWKYLLSIRDSEIKNGRHPPYSQYRYVSLDEINKIGKLVCNGRNNKFIEVRDVYGRPANFIFRPGFYRVEENHDGMPYLISFNRTNKITNTFNEWWYNRVKYGRSNDYHKTVLRRKLARRKRRIQRSITPKYAESFFQAVAMASAVGG